MLEDSALVAKFMTDLGDNVDDLEDTGSDTDEEQS